MFTSYYDRNRMLYYMFEFPFGSTNINSRVVSCSIIVWSWHFVKILIIISSFIILGTFQYTTFYFQSWITLMYMHYYTSIYFHSHKMEYFLHFLNFSYYLLINSKIYYENSLLKYKCVCVNIVFPFMLLFLFLL